jgi:hypothetical protein
MTIRWNQPEADGSYAALKGPISKPTGLKPLTRAADFYVGGPIS